MTVYIENEKGGIQSVTDEHFHTYLTTTTNDGGRFPIPGVRVIDEKEAKRKNPQLFGAMDPNVSYTAAEIVARADYAERLARLQAADAELHPAED